jgi:hypothetical protein
VDWVNIEVIQEPRYQAGVQLRHQRLRAYRAYVRIYAFTLTPLLAQVPAARPWR